jgi:hypothetical protein
MSLVIHVVPQLPPSICGVGDYAALVGGKIEEQSAELRCAYVACGYHAAEESNRSAGRRNATGSCNLVTLWRAIEELVSELAGGTDERMSLVVHYSGYGYARDGAPGWLADALERRPARFAAVRIITMFHELYATSWPWRRAFWYTARQRGVAVRIARISHALITNREASADWLRRAPGHAAGAIASLPIPSNVGEPPENLPWDARAPRAVAFGGANFKRSFFVGRGAKATAALCRKLEIETLICIGARAEIDGRAFRSHGIDVVETGFLPANDVSAHYCVARIALVDYYPGYLAKSGILATAAAHGVPPIFPRRITGSDGLRFGEQIWNLEAAMAASRDEATIQLSRMSTSIRDWYDGHNVEHHASLLADASCLEAARVG